MEKVWNVFFYLKSLFQGFSVSVQVFFFFLWQNLFYFIFVIFQDSFNTRKLPCFQRMWRSHSLSSGWTFVFSNVHRYEPSLWDENTSTSSSSHCFDTSSTVSCEEKHNKIIDPLQCICWFIKWYLFEKYIKILLHNNVFFVGFWHKK